MDMRVFTDIVTRGMDDAVVSLAPNGKDFELRAGRIPNLHAFGLVCGRLGFTDLSVGSAMGGGVLITFAGAAHREPENGWDGLTDREMRITQLLVSRTDRKTIAARMGLSIKTVDHYRLRILDKLGVSDTFELLMLAVRCGMAIEHGTAA